MAVQKRAHLSSCKCITPPPLDDDDGNTILGSAKSLEGCDGTESVECPHNDRDAHNTSDEALDKEVEQIFREYHMNCWMNRRRQSDIAEYVLYRATLSSLRPQNPAAILSTDLDA
ncbi:hypothetical protein QAD02_002517 [Eretmocerus hayati]|uniref:Uncharacterized protein n=1 Tax=Eretmocerus hayati TaxID=131215 RepID=A0ACC2NJ87_9HYME|nr:hypothetical protein QAD02_002517 [Eretmocerus hayati]